MFYDQLFLSGGDETRLSNSKTSAGPKETPTGHWSALKSDCSGDFAT
jgi:hypothetical protein